MHFIGLEWKVQTLQEKTLKSDRDYSFIGNDLQNLEVSAYSFGIEAFKTKYNAESKAAGKYNYNGTSWDYTPNKI